MTLRSHGYLEAPSAGYMLALVDRGADTCSDTGRIGAETADALKAEARRRSDATSSSATSRTERHSPEAGRPTSNAMVRSTSSTTTVSCYTTREQVFSTRRRPTSLPCPSCIRRTSSESGTCGRCSSEAPLRRACAGTPDGSQPSRSSRSSTSPVRQLAPRSVRARRRTLHEDDLRRPRLVGGIARGCRNLPRGRRRGARRAPGSPTRSFARPATTPSRPRPTATASSPTRRSSPNARGRVASSASP